MKAGRKTKYTPDTVKRITDAIKLGATDKLACAYAGIDESTFYAWIKEKSEFSDAVKEAEGAGAMQWLAKIEKAASEGSWQAAAWKLERRYPQMYGRTVHEHTGAAKANQAIDWRSEAIDALRKGQITQDVAIDVFGDELARELFAQAGVKHE